MTNSTKHLMTFADKTSAHVKSLIAKASEIKHSPSKFTEALKGKHFVAFFEKPSLRTRLSFDIGIQRLGGGLSYLDLATQQLTGREDSVDMAANISCWADGIIARVNKHETLHSLAQGGTVPVINALCDLYHPCQGLADYLTLSELFDDLTNVHIAYVGDGNNVTHSLLILGAHIGVNVSVVTPEGHEVCSEQLEQAKSIAQNSGSKIVTSNSINDLKNVDVIYTDTWISMGDETPLGAIKEVFMPYQVNEAMLQCAGAQYVMHCQPAHRDLEITGTLIDSKQSLLMHQAENRMHAQNAIMLDMYA